MTSKVSEVIKHGLIYGFGSLAQSAASFLLLPMYAKHLPPTEYGVFSLIQLVGTVAGTIFYLGANSTLPRSYFDYSNDIDRQKVFNTTLLLLAIGGIAQTLFGCTFSSIISEKVIGTNIYSHLVLVSLISSALTFINTGFIVYLRLLRKSTIIVVISILNLSLTVSFVYYFLVIASIGIKAPVYSILISQVLTITIFLLYFRKTISFSNIILRKISIQLKFGIFSVLASSSMLISQLGDRIILNNYLNIREVGIYSFGFKISMIYTVLIVIPFGMIWTPMMNEYKNDPKIKELFSRITFYYTLLSITVVVFAYYFVDEFFMLLGNAYTESARLVPMIIIGLFFDGLLNIFSAGIIYSRNIYILSYVYFIYGVLYILMNILIIPVYGKSGAIAVFVVTKLLIAVSVYLLAQRYFSFPLGLIRYLKILNTLGTVLIVDKIFNYFSLNGITFDIILFSTFIFSVYLYVIDEKEKTIILKRIFNR